MQTERLVYGKFSNILPRAIKREYFAKRTEKLKSFFNLLEKEVEKKTYGCPKVQDLVDEEIGICSGYSFRNKTTLHCSERNAKLFGDLIMHDLML